MAVVGVGVAPVGVGCGGATPPEERISDDRSGTGRVRRGIGIRAGSGQSDFGMPQCSRSSSPGRMASASAAKIPRSRRAWTHRAASGFDTDLPRRAGVIRGFSGGRAYRRQKSFPGRAPREEDVRTRIPSAPAPLRHRDSAHEAPPSRSSSARVALPDPANRHRRCTHLGVAPHFAFTVPENLRPSTRHRNLHRPTHTDINKTASQQNYTTTRLHNDTTTKQNSTTGKQKTMTSVSTEVSQY